MHWWIWSSCRIPYSFTKPIQVQFWRPGQSLSGYEIWWTLQTSYSRRKYSRSKCNQLCQPSSLFPTAKYRAQVQAQTSQSQMLLLHPRKPSYLPPCVSAGKTGDAFRHNTGSKYCSTSLAEGATHKSAEGATHKSAEGATQKSSSRKASSNAPPASNSNIVFNVDSGTNDHSVFNKDEVNIYSTLHHPIEVADGRHAYAQAIGSLCSTLHLKDVLVVPEFTQNLLSTSKMDSTLSFRATRSTLVATSAHQTL